MTETPHIARVSWDGLSPRDLERLARSAREAGRHATAERAIAELHHRGIRVASDLLASRPPPRAAAAPRRTSVLAWSVRGLAALVLVAIATFAAVRITERPAGPEQRPQVASARPQPAAPPFVAPGQTVARAPEPSIETRVTPARRQPETLAAAQPVAPPLRLSTLRPVVEPPVPTPAPTTTTTVLAMSGSGDLKTGDCSGGACGEPGRRASTGYPASPTARIVVARNVPLVAAPSRQASPFR